MIVEPVRPQDLTLAFEHSLMRVPEENRAARVQLCLGLVDRGVVDPRGIWVAREADVIVGVQVCVALSRSSSLFWLPSAPTPIADALVQAALDQLRGEGCKIAQALVKKEDEEWVEPLCRRGFRRVTQLHQMAHSLAELPKPIGPTLRYEPYRPALIESFAATLERTYLDSLDCPELNGARTIDEIVASHQGQGTFHPECWWLVFDENKAIGVIILAELSEALTWELAYVGIVPEARGRGFGRAMTLHAMHAVSTQPTIALTLAVEARNLPAQHLSESLGFIEFDCFEVLLHLW